MARARIDPARTTARPFFSRPGSMARTVRHSGPTVPSEASSGAIRHAALPRQNVEVEAQRAHRPDVIGGDRPHARRAADLADLLHRLEEGIVLDLADPPIRGREDAAPERAL